MSVLDELSDGARKLFLMNVGAVAFGAEKSKDIVSDLVKRGEITVEQGKKLDGELKRRAASATGAFSDTVLEEHIKGMTDEERAAFVAKVSDFAAKATASDVPVETTAEEKNADSADSASADSAA